MEFGGFVDRDQHEPTCRVLAALRISTHRFMLNTVGNLLTHTRADLLALQTTEPRRGQHALVIAVVPLRKRTIDRQSRGTLDWRGWPRRTPLICASRDVPERMRLKLSHRGFYLFISPQRVIEGVAARNRKRYRDARGNGGNEPHRPVGHLLAQAPTDSGEIFQP